jgi:hypothetical protein
MEQQLWVRTPRKVGYIAGVRYLIVSQSPDAGLEMPQSRHWWVSGANNGIVDLLVRLLDKHIAGTSPLSYQWLVRAPTKKLLLLDAAAQGLPKYYPALCPPTVNSGL